MIIQRILSLLDEKSLKASDLCKVLGINTSTFTNWKKRQTDPPAKFIFPICEFLNVDCETLLTGKSTSPKPDNNEDLELLRLIHALPFEERLELKGYLRGRSKALNSPDQDEERTGTENLGK